MQRGLAVALIHILMCHILMLALVVKRVDFHKDMCRFVLYNGVARLIKILVCDAAVVVEDFVIPFGAVKFYQAAAVLGDGVKEIAPP